MQVAVREFYEEEREKHRIPVRPPQVLLAEDDPALRLLICFLLQRRGFEVEMVEDGEAALEELGSLLGPSRACLPDLIITDYRMPRFDGLDVIEAMRLVGDHTPIILITAFGDSTTHARAELLGVTAVLDKPFDLDELVSIAQRATTYSV